MASYPGIDRINLARLRASLLLILPEHDVHTATSGLPDDPEIESEALRWAIRSAQFRLFRQRFLGPFRRLVGHAAIEAENEVFHIVPGSTNEGLTLLLHLGAGLSSRQCADLLETPHQRILEDLLNARLTLLNRVSSPETIIGAYRDAQVDLPTAASISRRRAASQDCAELLDAFEELDDRLLRRIRDNEYSNAVQEPARIALSRRLLGAVPIVLVASFLAAAVMAAGGLAGNLLGAGDSPLFATEPVEWPGDKGWIIYGTWDGGLHAFDPVSSQRKVLHPEYFTASMLDGANYLVSPDGERVAIFAQNDVPGLYWATRRVGFVTITGEEINEIQWSLPDEAGWPTGWLGNDELLIVSIPEYQSGETSERFLQRLEEESRLRAVDIETGEQRTVFEGAVAQVIPSPDATRLAIVRPRDPTEPGVTVDLWSIRDGVADAQIASVEHRFNWSGGLLWSQNSESLYLGRIAAFEPRVNERSRDDAFRGQITSIEILRLGRDGEREVAVAAPDGTGMRIAGVDPGDERIVVNAFSLENRDDPHQFMVQDRRSGEQSSIDPPGIDLQFSPTMNGTLGYPAGFAAHPDGFPFVLHLGAEHYLRADPAYHFFGPPQAVFLTLIDEDLEPSVVSVSSDRWPVTPLRWVDGDLIDLNEPPEIDHARDYSAPVPAAEVRSYAQLGGDSAVSQDRMALPMVEVTNGSQRPYLWFPVVDTGRWIASQTTEISWLTDSHAFVGVTRLGSDDNARTLITQHSANQRGGSSIDAFFDPLSLDEDTSQRYARPATSPDASRTSFYLVDEERDLAQLWISDWSNDLQQVREFAIPSGRTGLAPLTAFWLDRDSLLFTETREWSNGLPVEVALNRLELTGGDDVNVQRILTIGTTGRDRGVALTEFSVHPGGEFLAYRQRHFTDRDDPESGYDTVHIAPADDVSSSLEIDRGDMSSGLDWSPGGQALALGSGGRIGVYSLESHGLAFVSGNERIARHPAWVSNTELWFNMGSEDDATVYRVLFGD